jgi:hypothetical protein
MVDNYNTLPLSYLLAMAKMKKASARKNITLMLLLDIPVGILWVYLTEVPFPWNVSIAIVFISLVNIWVLRTTIREYLFWKASIDSYKEVFQ